MKQYEAYKDSGIQWLGKIPSHWTPIAMKFYFYMKGRIGWQGLKADEFIEEGPYLVTGTDFENGKVIWERCYHISEERYNEAPEIHVEKGDLLITKDGTVGKLALIDEKPEKVSLNSHLLILRPVKPNINNHFIYWALQADNFIYYTGLTQNGSIMASLSQEKIGDYKIALPSIDEQQVIATYLEHKVGQIEEAIAEKEQMLEDLKAYRSAIISEAVTKGLDKKVEMKDSGIEWIDTMPKHWKKMKIKNLSNLQSGSSLVSEQILDKGMYPVFGGNGIRGYYNEYNVEGVHVLIGRQGALCGNINMANGKFWATEHAVVCHPIVDYNAEWFAALLEKMNLNQYSQSAAQPGLSVEKIKNLYIPVPPKEEQILIGNYLDHKNEQINQSILELQSQTNDLRAYKSSIITDAVTGKMDLRDWKPKQVNA